MPPLPDGTRPARVYIGLGGNLGDPVRTVLSGRQAIRDMAGVRETGFSSLYRSTPMGPSAQPDYVNAVMAIDTVLSPLALLDGLQAIEARHGRVRQGERWGPRTLDLDLLLYGDQMIRSKRLIVPHAGIAGREFVLYPLQEVAGELQVPGHGALSDLVARCPQRGLSKIPLLTEAEA